MLQRALAQRTVLKPIVAIAGIDNGWKTEMVTKFFFHLIYRHRIHDIQRGRIHTIAQLANTNGRKTMAEAFAGI